jgi:hypothetical protein
MAIFLNGNIAFFMPSGVFCLILHSANEFEKKLNIDCEKST